MINKENIQGLKHKIYWTKIIIYEKYEGVSVKIQDLIRIKNKYRDLIVNLPIFEIKAIQKNPC